MQSLPCAVEFDFLLTFTRLKEASLKIGIDLGGTKIEIIAIDESGKELLRERRATPPGYDSIVRAIKEMVFDCEDRLGSKAEIGVGIPGAISPATGLVKNANSVCLIGHALDRDLSKALNRNIRLTNDANCFALSEATDGAGEGAEVVFGVIIGTGVGAGIVIKNHVFTGPNSIAGEWGHNPLPWKDELENPGPLCYCGKYGCIETFLAGPSLARDHKLVTGEDLSAAEIVSRAAVGDTNAEATLARYDRRLAKSLATVINVLDPNVIVLGGGLSNLERLYKNVPAIWGEYVFSDRVDTRLERARFGDSSGVRGAAWLGSDVKI